jgi:hypothetical protein
VTVDQPADTVLATVSPVPADQQFLALARALACAARVVRSNGRIVLLTQVAGPLGEQADQSRQAEDPAEAAAQTMAEVPAEQPMPDRRAAFLWTHAVQQASVLLLSGLPEETAEELFTTPLENARQVQRLLDSGGSCLFLPDAHRTLAVLDEQVDSEES